MFKNVCYLFFIYTFLPFSLLTNGDNNLKANVNEKTVEQAREFLKAAPEKQKELTEKLKKYNGNINQVIKVLAKEDLQPRLPLPKENIFTRFGLPEFNTPQFKEKYPDACLFYYFPKNFDPKNNYGLLVYMHGGGNGIKPKQAGFYVTRYELDKRIREADAPFIIVAPSYSNPKGTSRWILAKADDFIEAVIKESKHRFNIDPNRIALSGFSMGASGAWHLGQRLSDKLSACLIIAGGYWATNFKGYTGLPLFMVIGQYDGWIEQSRHFRGQGSELTDEERPPRPLDPKRDSIIHAHFKLKELNIPHVLKWHQGGHTLLNEARPGIERFAKWVKTKKRDPFFPKVFVLSPCGGNVSIKGLKPTFDRRWVSILATKDGTVDYTWHSMKKTHGKSWRPMKGETFDDFRKRRWNEIFTKKYKGAWVEAEYMGNNKFDVKTKNVTKFALWLHPEMIDFSKPVKVNVNGREMTFKDLKPNLVDALRSYKRRQDWSMIYPCELVIDVPVN